MFDTFGRGLSSEIFDYALQQSWDLESNYFYEGNTPIQEYMGLMMDLYGATDTLSGTLSNLRHEAGHAILRLLDEVNIADKMLDDGYLEGIRDQNEDMGGGGELVRSIEEVRGLSKNKILELIPQICELVQCFMQTRGAFECLDELFAEVKNQNNRLEQQIVLNGGSNDA